MRDLLHLPIIGPFLKWRHSRTVMQTVLLAVAALILFDGFFGPQLAPRNLATVSVWLHFRGLVVLALLVAGNLFCMACPFMLPRQIARRLRQRFLAGGRPWPAALRNKWLTGALVIAFFFSYELFDLWASPWLTAWLLLGYFLVAFVVDLCFRGASFCKYVCPLGQFNFFGSLISPLEIKVRDPHTCAACPTKDCIKGRLIPVDIPIVENNDSLSVLNPGHFRGRPSAVNIPGCELWLFQPRKVGNMDCTFCLDCIHACPYDNVGILARLPTAELWSDPFRSGLGRFSRRLDLAALVAVFVFGAYINAFGMIRPVYALQARLAAALHTSSPAPGLALIFLLGLVVLPTFLLIAAAWLTRVLGRLPAAPLSHTLARFTFALVPLGFAMWLAHYTFHFLTGGLTLLPVLQSFLADVGLFAGAPRWDVGAVVPRGWLFPLEAVMLYAGATASIIAAFQIARRVHPAGTRPRILGVAAPWISLTLLLLAFGLWILVQPMEMRGTLMMLSSGTTP